MPYPQDLVGKYVNYVLDSGGILHPGLAAAFVDGLLPGQTTVANVSVYAAAPAPPVVGVAPPPGLPGPVNVVNTNAPWNFTFLKYYAGAVTTAPLTTAVLTGPMSGCYLCTYTQGGQNLAHIGTANAPDSEATRSVKAAWMTFVARDDVSSIMGASPFDFYTQGQIAAEIKNGVIPSIYGYFDGTGAYAILFFPLPRNMNPPGLNLAKVIAVKRMTMQPWSAIAAMAKFATERTPIANPYDPSIIRLS